MPRSNFGHIERIGEGKYRLWWKAGFDGDGKRKRPSSTFYGTRDEAEMELAVRYIAENGPDGDTTYLQLWEAVVDPSLDKLAVRTREGHRRIWNAELSRRIASTRVRDTTRSLIEEKLGEIESPWVQRSALQTWRKMFNMAGLEMRSPFDRSIRLKRAVPAKRPYLDASEVAGWLDLIRGREWAPVLVAEAGGGLRHEEACALDADDVRRVEHRGRAYAVVEISKALTAASSGRVLKDTKNGFSERTMVIGEPFAGALLESMPESGPLCPSRRKGGSGAKAYMSPNDITAEYRRLCESEGAKYVNPGKLRGSWRTMQGEAGSPSDLVRKAMGHAGGETDERHYLRASKRGLVMLADNLTNLIEDDDIF